MKIYNYDKITKEYLFESEANVDIEASKKAGINIYYLPADATSVKPPKTVKFEVAIYENGWQITPDFRNEWITDKSLIPMKHDKIGELPQGFIYITEAQYKKIINDKDYYILEDNKLIENPNYQEIKYKENLDKLIQHIYELKAKKAYGGVLINNTYLFETNQISITNTVASLALMGTSTNWKFYTTDNLPIAVKITKTQLNKIAKFGQAMIDAAFEVEGKANEQLKQATIEQINDVQWQNDFMIAIEKEMNEVNYQLEMEL